MERQQDLWKYTLDRDQRITREDMFMEMLDTLAKRSTCNRKQVAALIVREGRIISMGYAGAPSGLAHCLDVGCDIDENTGGCTRTVHAEASAIAYAARMGIATEGAILYCTMSPCIDCAKIIINAGIKEVHFQVQYRDVSGIQLLQKAGVGVFGKLY